jgi:hypothetical protein
VARAVVRGHERSQEGGEGVAVLHDVLDDALADDAPEIDGRLAGRHRADATDAATDRGRFRFVKLRFVKRP